jgi:hypothetical protein
MMRLRARSLTFAALTALLGIAIGCGGGNQPRQPAQPRLAWAPPPLHNAITVRVAADRPTLELAHDRDYRIVLPDHPLSLRNGLAINGGHNVVLIGGQIVVPPSNAAKPGTTGRGLYLLNQTGTIHIEGVRFSGEGLTEGIDLGESLGATVQLENIRLDEIFYPRTLRTHPDVIQTWAGPTRLRVDRLTATTQYQGFFLQPQQLASVRIRSFELRNIDLTGSPRSAYLLWQGGSAPRTARNVWIRNAGSRPTAQLMWPKPVAWRGVQVGRPHSGSFVPQRASGTGYRSPGYSQR